MERIEELLDEHRRIEERMAELLRVVDARVPDAATVAMLRWDLVGALAEHHAREDRWICARVIHSSDTLAARAAWHHRRTAGTVRDGVMRFVAEWPVARVAAQWTPFGAAMREMLALLAERIAWEERELFVHAGRVLRRGVH